MHNPTYWHTFEPHTRTRTQSLSHTHAHTQTNLLTLKDTHTPSDTHFLSLSLTYTHLLTRTKKHTHFFINASQSPRNWQSKFIFCGRSVRFKSSKWNVHTVIVIEINGVTALKLTHTCWCWRPVSSPKQFSLLKSKSGKTMKDWTQIFYWSKAPG